MKILICTFAIMFSFSVFSATVVKVKSSASIRKESFKESCGVGVDTTREDLQSKCNEVEGVLGEIDYTIQKDVHYVSCIVAASAKCVTDL